MNLDSTLDQILHVAHTRGAAPATRLVLRQDVADLIAREDGSLRRLDSCGVPYEVTDTIPAFPGFKVER